jgi:predicted RNase H-like HicB family nuclease
LTAILHREGDLYVAECPEVGTVSQGSSLEEAITNLKEATELFLEEFPSSRRRPRSQGRGSGRLQVIIDPENPEPWH